MFLNVLREIFKRQDDIPKRDYEDPTGREDYEWFCEVIHETILDKLQHYASPVEAHKQMYIFTYWFSLNWKNCEKSVPQLVGEIQAMTNVKHSSR